MHRGAEMAIAMPSLPGRSRVFRKLRRGDLHQLRPDYQDLLIDVTLWVWLRRGADSGTPPLVDRVETTLREPSSVTRSGGLSLGESSYLVNEVLLETDPPAEALFLMPDASGFYALPVWVDHVSASGSRSKRFTLEKLQVDSALARCWFAIGES
jgi:CRISPR-associated protein Cas5t